MTASILIVEDHKEIADLVRLHLRDAGYRASSVGDGRTALANIRSSPCDLVILDLMLPDMDGLELCQQLRAHADYTPILMLTSKSSEADRILGLELGADDYLTKPFSILELLARVKAILRRVRSPDSLNEKNQAQEIVRAHELVIDRARHRVLLRGQEVQLTAREFDLLLHFAQSPGRVYTRTQLLDSVWGYEHAGYEHTVNSHINRLRAKIEVDPAQPRYILTVWGVGYKFSEAPEA